MILSLFRIELRIEGEYFVEIRDIMKYSLRVSKLDTFTDVFKSERTAGLSYQVETELYGIRQQGISLIYGQYEGKNSIREMFCHTFYPLLWVL
jgi:hypothetical protein